MTTTTTRITDPLEALSKWLPRFTNTIRANAHTLRMLQARTGRNVIDLEVEEHVRNTGVFGYLWSTILFIDETQPDGTFIYKLEDEASVDDTLGGIEIGGTSYAHKHTGEPFYTPIAGL